MSLRKKRWKRQSAHDRSPEPTLIIDINFFVVHNICITLKVCIASKPRGVNGDFTLQDHFQSFLNFAQVFGGSLNEEHNHKLPWWLKYLEENYLYLNFCLNNFETMYLRQSWNYKREASRRGKISLNHPIPRSRWINLKLEYFDSCHIQTSLRQTKLIRTLRGCLRYNKTITHLV